MCWLWCRPRVTSGGSGHDSVPAAPVFLEDAGGTTPARNKKAAQPARTRADATSVSEHLAPRQMSMHDLSTTLSAQCARWHHIQHREEHQVCFPPKAADASAARCDIKYQVRLQSCMLAIARNASDNRARRSPWLRSYLESSFGSPKVSPRGSYEIPAPRSRRSAGSVPIAEHACIMSPEEPLTRTATSSLAHSTTPLGSCRRSTFGLAALRSG
jgi:hypothetical protein